MTENDMNTLLKSQQGELDAVLMYKALAKTVRKENDRAVFLQLAAEEGHHASVFKNLSGKALTPKKTLAVLLPVLYRIMGRKRLYPIIAKFEYNAANTYQPVAEKYPEVESVKNDEKRHGDTVMALLK